MVTITYGDGGFVQRLESLAGQLQRPAALAPVLGRKAVTVLKKHFREKDKSNANKLSDRRTHFWRAVADSVQAPVVDGSANRITVSVNHTGLAQRYFGGTIRAKRVSLLTIPVSEEAYGRTARTFEQETGSKLIFIRVGGKAANRFSNAVLATERGGGLQIEYVLTPSVNQEPDPSALPEQNVMEQEIAATAESFVARQVARSTKEVS